MPGGMGIRYHKHHTHTERERQKQFFVEEPSFSGHGTHEKRLQLAMLQNVRIDTEGMFLHKYIGGATAGMLSLLNMQISYDKKNIFAYLLRNPVVDKILCLSVHQTSFFDKHD